MVVVEARLCMDETRSRVCMNARRRDGSLNGGIMCRPFRVHVLQLLQCVDGLRDGTTECSTILVILKLMYMASDGASFVVGCRVCQRFACICRKVQAGTHS